MQAECSNHAFGTTSAYAIYDPRLLRRSLQGTPKPSKAQLKAFGCHRRQRESQTMMNYYLKKRKPGGWLYMTYLIFLPRDCRFSAPLRLSQRQLQSAHPPLQLFIFLLLSPVVFTYHPPRSEALPPPPPKPPAARIEYASCHFYGLQISQIGCLDGSFLEL